MIQQLLRHGLYKKKKKKYKRLGPEDTSDCYKALTLESELLLEK